MLLKLKTLQERFNNARYLLATGVVFAKDVNISPPSVFKETFDFGSFFSALISIIIIIAFLAAFFYLLWGGFTWITSGGDEAGITAARQRIVQALIGLTIVVAVWALFQLVEGFFGISIFGPEGFTIPGIGGGTSTSSPNPGLPGGRE